MKLLQDKVRSIVSDMLPPTFGLIIDGSLRQSTHPDTLNLILFLKANRHLWSNALIIEDILNERSADDVAEILTDLPVVNQDDEETNTEPAY